MKSISGILSFWFAAIVGVILLVLIFSPNCKHEERRAVYSFNAQDGIIQYKYTGYIRYFCKDCDYYLGITYLGGKPIDTPYLDLIREHTDGDELVGGEYYTMTAIVSFCDYYPEKTMLSCRVENENTRVGFSVEFREEFEELIDLVQEGDEITFRGKFNDMSCDWTDCELIG